ncbi:MAG: histidine phosphatase family protein [Pseudomonadota bacterium]
MTRLFLVRHGPTHAKFMVGWSDLPADLSDSAALGRLSGYLPKNAIVVSSDLSRAADTASAIQGDRLRLPHQRDLREIHFGDWELRRHADIEAEDPERIRAYWEFPGDVRPPNGESWNEVCERVNTAIDDLILRHGHQDLVVVGHFGMILTQVQRALHLDANEAFAHRIDNLSVTQISRAQNGWEVGVINHRP